MPGRALRCPGRKLNPCLPGPRSTSSLPARASPAARPRGCSRSRGRESRWSSGGPIPLPTRSPARPQIQSSAVPAIERLGLAPLLEHAGAVRSRAAAWTPYGGWLRFPADAPPGYGITRRSLDPVVRELALEDGGRRVLPRPDGRSRARRRRSDQRRRGREPGPSAPHALRDAHGGRRRARLDTRSTGSRSRPGAPTQPLRVFRVLAWRTLAEGRGPDLDARSGRRRRLSQRGRRHHDRGRAPTTRGYPSSVPIPRPRTTEWSASSPMVRSSPVPSGCRS